jgi:UDP-N-acetyl-D-galactosamine dehydrogenase
MNLQNKTIAVIGLGYVGLPLAVEFGKIRPVIGFDINPHRIAELLGGVDHSLECNREELAEASQLRYTTNPDDLRQAQVFIITVPTPVDRANRPEMGPLVKASSIVATVLKKGDLVIYESTVYPGATEETCVPVLEQYSGLSFNIDFFCGYSPERINPGDKAHRLPDIVKVTSGSTPDIAQEVDILYKEIIVAGTHKVSSIKVAEAAKVIENTQRDVNIALMNELSLFFNKLGIDTLEVLEAAGTKWNFLPFRPGLVGGHCISVDPYYLTHKAQEVGYHPAVILAGRRINDMMPAHVADETVKLMLSKRIQVLDAKVLVLGLTFKEDCPDIRNSKVVAIVKALERYNTQVDVYDPWVDPAEVEAEYDLKCLMAPPATGEYSAIVLAVAHKQFKDLGADGVRSWGQPNVVLFDVKGILPQGEADARL